MMLTNEQRRAIAAAIPRGVAVPAEFWEKLADAIDLCRNLEARRACRPPAAEREHEKRIKRLADALYVELRDDDPFKRMLAERRRRAENLVEGHGMIAAGFGRRKNAHRAVFYDTVLALWQFDLDQGQKLAVSTEGGMHRGPLIRFFAACCAALDGHVLSTETVASIIRRYKARRRKRRR